MKNLIFLISLIISINAIAQSSYKTPKYLGDTFRLDTATAILIPIQYNNDMYQSKFDFEAYYANFVVFNYITNTKRYIFDENKFIMRFYDSYYTYRNNKNEIPKNITGKGLFFLVKNMESRISQKPHPAAPNVLYYCDLFGNNLKALTPSTENAYSFEVFEKFDFVLVKMQRDLNNDVDFNYKDKDFYYMKIDLSTLLPVAKIEINP